MLSDEFLAACVLIHHFHYILIQFIVNEDRVGSPIFGKPRVCYLNSTQIEAIERFFNLRMGVIVIHELLRFYWIAMLTPVIQVIKRMPLLATLKGNNQLGIIRRFEDAIFDDMISHSDTVFRH